MSWLSIALMGVREFAIANPALTQQIITSAIDVGIKLHNQIERGNAPGAVPDPPDPTAQAEKNPSVSKYPDEQTRREIRTTIQEKAAKAASLPGA